MITQEFLLQQAGPEATACLAYMEERGLKEIKYIGPFGGFKDDFKQWEKVRIPKGTKLRSTNPAKREYVAQKSHVITVVSLSDGYCSDGKAYPPSINWAGAGSYWVEADANDVEVVK